MPRAGGGDFSFDADFAAGRLVKASGRLAAAGVELAAAGGGATAGAAQGMTDGASPAAFKVERFLNTVRIMASPTAASAAATTITKRLKIWPFTCFNW